MQDDDDNKESGEGEARLQTREEFVCTYTTAMLYSEKKNSQSFPGSPTSAPRPQ